MRPENKTQLFIFLILFFTNFCCLGKNINWDYNKGGADWPEECKKGNQAPIDIGKPFEYKSNK